MKPPVNCDAARFSAHEHTWLAWITRDYMGHIKAYSLLMPGIIDISSAKAMCVCEALSWVKNCDLSEPHIETDALVMVQAINANLEDDSFFDSLISNCVDLINQIPGVVVLHLFRSMNRVPYYLARPSISKPVLNDWGCNLPHALSYLAIQDLAQ